MVRRGSAPVGSNPAQDAAIVGLVIQRDHRSPRGAGLLSRRDLTYVIGEPCLDVKDLSCVSVCTEDCIHPTEDQADFAFVRQLSIDPAECIDCDASVEAHPVDAIFPEDQPPEEWQIYTRMNADYSPSRRRRRRRRRESLFAGAAVERICWPVNAGRSNRLRASHGRGRRSTQRAGKKKALHCRALLRSG